MGWTQLHCLHMWMHWFVSLSLLMLAYHMVVCDMFFLWKNYYIDTWENNQHTNVYKLYLFNSSNMSSMCPIPKSSLFKISKFPVEISICRTHSSWKSSSFYFGLRGFCDSNLTLPVEPILVENRPAYTLDLEDFVTLTSLCLSKYTIKNTS